MSQCLRRLVLALFWSLTLSQAYSDPPAVLIDEFDAGGRQGLLDHYERGRPRVHFPGLKVTNGYDADMGRIGKLLLAPIKQPTSRPAL